MGFKPTRTLQAGDKVVVLKGDSLIGGKHPDKTRLIGNTYYVGCKIEKYNNGKIHMLYKLKEDALKPNGPTNGIDTGWWWMRNEIAYLGKE